ncbi:MAG: hypothetical protein JW984_14845 [Deltaproteobacteria bacterium]|uniref:Uncharacterized protein n=1 Tax=Candidatus Zymogenus saltonus TaxID=2844893 RepID=A0A9D8PRY0_9DELT|nr:hypothetical protein [Candidatus Zymogenus saltonus]
METRTTSTDVSIEIHADYVKKSYHTNIGNFPLQRVKFLRELEAYERFKKIGAEFVPNLIAYDIDLQSITLERIEGIDICEILENCSEYDLNRIIDHIIHIDSFLYKNNINCLYTSPKELIYQVEMDKLFLLDFEYTFVNEYFHQILLENIYQNPKMKRINNVRCLDEFVELSKRRLIDVEKYHYRKVKTYLLSKLGMIRKKGT